MNPHMTEENRKFFQAVLSLESEEECAAFLPPGFLTFFWKREFPSIAATVYPQVPVMPAVFSVGRRGAAIR